MHESTHAFLQKKRQTLGLFRVGVRRSINVLGKRAGQASEPVKISPTLPSTINYRSNIRDIETKQLILQIIELNSMSNFTTLATLW
jgi:hypothetical protein